MFVGFHPTYKLNELNKATTTMSLSMLADYRVAKGKLIELDVKEYGLKGLYLITQCKHTIKNKDLASITIEKYA